MLHEDDLLAVFAEYRKAVESKDGQATATMLAEPTIEYYKRMAALALKGSPAKLQRSALGDQVTALSLRQLFLPKELEGMSGEDVVAAAVETGIIDIGNRQKFKPGEVSIFGLVATVEMELPGPGVIPLTFRFEDEGWRLDLVSLNPTLEIYFRHLMKKEGLSETEFVVGVVSVFTGTPLTEEIYDPNSNPDVPTV